MIHCSFPRRREWVVLFALLAAAAPAFGQTPSGAAAEVSAMPAGSHPAERLARFLLEHDGAVLISPSGRRYVPVLDRAGDEFWRLDRAGDVADVGTLRLDVDARELVVDWATDPVPIRHAIARPLPLVPTGERHGAVELAAALPALGRDVWLPFAGRDSVAFRFGDDGHLVARSRDGDVAGTWRLSGGRILVRLAGVPLAAAYLWQQLAAHVGWADVGVATAEAGE